MLDSQTRFLGLGCVAGLAAHQLVKRGNRSIACAAFDMRTAEGADLAQDLDILGEVRQACDGLELVGGDAVAFAERGLGQ